MVETKVVEKLETHIFCSINFFPPENIAIHDTMWKNIVERSRPPMTIWRVYIACWIPKATNTHSEYVIIIAFPLQLLHEYASVLCYMYITFFFRKSCLFEIMWRKYSRAGEATDDNKIWRRKDVICLPDN